MSNNMNSSSIVRHIVFDNTSNSSTTAIWIINERNSTLVNLDVHPSIVRIMWYRFLLIIIIFVTAAGNVLVCLAIARERKLQNTTNYFLMSLAIADCLVAILVMPMGMIAEVLGYFPLPHYACIIFATMDVLCCTSSIWHMSTMSMDRYFTIRFPFRYGRNKTRRIMLLKIIAVWAISAAVSSPVFVLGIVDKQNVLVNGTCAPNNASFKLYGSVFAFYIPFIIMIATYALTMRSLRNVLVHKKKYNREKRRKQTFRPLAQIIHQYAEIAQNIRRTSSTNNQTSTSPTHNNTSNSSILNKTPYTIITTATSPIDTRTQFFPSNNFDLNSKQDLNTSQYGSLNITNGTNNEIILHNNQCLTISYIKSSGNKKRRAHQQPLKTDCDMSTVYEITEYSKSTSSSHEIPSNTGTNVTQKSIPINEQQQQQSLKIIDSTEQQPISNTTTTTSTINTISPLREEDASSTTDIDSGTEGNDMEILFPISSIHPYIESTSLRIPWEYYSILIEYILQYYRCIFPYRSRLLAIKSSSNTNEVNERLFVSDQSTSTSSISPIGTRNHCRSVSTQTNSLPPIDLPVIQSNNNNESFINNPIKRRKFPFHRPILPSSSLFTNLFRQSSTTLLHSRDCSTKSSISLGHRSSAASSTCPTRPQYPNHHYSSNAFHQIESEVDNISTDEHRPRASSSSSSALLRTTRRYNYSESSHWRRPIRRRHQYQSHSAYFITNPTAHNFRQRQTLTSTTTSSDSSSVFHRFNSRYLSSISQQQQQQSHSQRLRDEHIVAANERKALKVLMIIFCVFVTLWTPFFICTFISAVCAKCRESISSTIWFSITWLGYSSSMANPFIYTIFSDVFRRAFTNILLCRSKDSLFSRQISTKLSYQKGAIAHQYIHQQYSYKRSPNHEYSRASTPIPVQHPPPVDESEATIYVNRCVSDSFR